MVITSILQSRKQRLKSWCNLPRVIVLVREEGKLQSQCSHAPHYPDDTTACAAATKGLWEPQTGHGLSIPMANQVDSEVKIHMCTSVPQQNLGLVQKRPYNMWRLAYKQNLTRNAMRTLKDKYCTFIYPFPQLFPESLACVQHCSHPRECGCKTLSQALTKLSNIKIHWKVQTRRT